jgi:hypothetical protein
VTTTDPAAPPELVTVEPADVPAVNPLTGAPLIARDRFGRPKVVPEWGGNAVAYTRCTTFVGCVEDMYLLQQWQMRHVARGIALNDDLIAAVRDTDPDNKDGLNFLHAEARKRSGAGDAAALGTYMHTVTEAADRGLDPGSVELPWLSSGAMDPSAYIPDLAAYLDATAPFKHRLIEQFMVQDPLKVGGTPDRIVQYQGKRYIADLKTGVIDLGTLKIAAQLAMYARSRPYDHVTATRGEPHGAEIDRGIIIHLPVGAATCRLYWVDLLAGWDVVKTAQAVRETRKLRWNALARELTHVRPAPLTLADQITSCVTAEEVRALWRVHAVEWTDDLTKVAKGHIAALALAEAFNAPENPTATTTTPKE